MNLKNRLLSAGMLVAVCMGVLAPSVAAAAPYHRGHNVCHWDRHHHRVCHWVR